MNQSILITIVIGMLVTAALVSAVSAYCISRASARQLERMARENDRLRQELSQQNGDTRREIGSTVSQSLGAARQEIARTVQESVTALGTALGDAQRRSGALQDKRIEELTVQFSQRSETLQRTVSEQLSRVEARFDGFTKQSDLRMEAIRQTMETRIASMQEDNSKKLEQMRRTVDEKLQKTLDERLAQSFTQVSERLEQVYKGLGEMQTLAAGVGDLKKVLSNVKTRGILGEIQLGAILEQILSPDQFDQNVVTRRGSTAVVEYAVRLPGGGSEPVYLPIDAKFPGDAYANLVDAYDGGDSEAILAMGKELETRLKKSAKDIHDKYLDPPNTTDFAIMFLPVEGLYAEAVRRGMVETLQRDYKVNIAGPTTMAALLNSLQMGFKTLAIQKRSSEVWDVLGAVKTEFGNFAKVLETAQGRLRKAGEELDLLIGTRTRAIERKLRGVTVLPGEKASELLELPEFTESRE